jgi:hypothetical protein
MDLAEGNAVTGYSFQGNAVTGEAISLRRNEQLVTAFPK